MILYKIEFSEGFDITTNDQGLFLRLRFQRPLAVLVYTAASELIHAINLACDTGFKSSASSTTP
ncbi:hypothetical protein J2769_001669 [Acinetobacter guillouiae]|nr:hypothetical protein [Acinetobacter guillouiae]